jgi:hypothetical protein
MKSHFRHFRKSSDREERNEAESRIEYAKKECFQSVLKCSKRFCAGDVRRKTVPYSGGSNGKRTITDRRQTSPRHHQFRDER